MTFSGNTASIKKSAIIVGLGKYSNVLFSFIANIILARILSPNEYGIVAIITVFSSFFMLFTDMGFGAGIIQKKDLSQNDIDHIFSFTVYIGLGCTAIFCALSPVIAAVYSRSVYIPIGCILSLSLFFHSANMVPNGLLMRKKRFGRVGLRTFLVSLVTYTLTILLALRGASYYSLVFQSVLSAFLTFSWNFFETRPKFIKKPKYLSLKKILSFSVNSFTYDIINYFTRNVDNLLTGSMIGEVALGYYNKAYTLMLYPTQYLTNIITPVMHPILSEYKDKNIIYRKYMKVNHFLLLVGILISVYCYSAAYELIYVLFGVNWIEAVSCMRILSLSIFIQMTISSCTSIFRCLDRTDLRLKSCFVYAPIQIILIILGAMTGDIENLSIYVTVSYIVRYGVEYYYLISKAFEMSLIAFLKENIGGLGVFFVLMTVMYFTKWLQIKNVIQSAAIKLFICIVIYIVALIIFKQTSAFSSLLPQKIRKRFEGKK